MRDGRVRRVLSKKRDCAASLAVQLAQAHPIKEKQ
jgi:hypothetical protein